MVSVIEVKELMKKPLLIEKVGVQTILIAWVEEINLAECIDLLVRSTGGD